MRFCLLLVPFQLACVAETLAHTRTCSCCSWRAAAVSSWQGTRAHFQPSQSTPPNTPPCLPALPADAVHEVEEKAKWTVDHTKGGQQLIVLPIVPLCDMNICTYAPACCACCVQRRCTRAQRSGKRRSAPTTCRRSGWPTVRPAGPLCLGHSVWGTCVAWQCMGCSAWGAKERGAQCTGRSAALHGSRCSARWLDCLPAVTPVLLPFGGGRLSFYCPLTVLQARCLATLRTC